jgi:hypothetical protein
MSLICDDYTKDNKTRTYSCTLTYQLDITASIAGNPPSTYGRQNENDTPDTTGAPSATKVESKLPMLINRILWQLPRGKERKRHRCRRLADHHQKARETQLQETSLILQALIKVSESNFNELGIESASLKWKLWECPDCRDRYLYNRGPESNDLTA